MTALDHLRRQVVAVDRRPVPLEGVEGRAQLLLEPARHATELPHRLADLLGGVGQNFRDDHRIDPGQALLGKERGQRKIAAQPTQLGRRDDVVGQRHVERVLVAEGPHLDELGPEAAGADADRRQCGFGR